MTFLTTGITKLLPRAIDGATIQADFGLSGITLKKRFTGETLPVIPWEALYRAVSSQTIQPKPIGDKTMNTQEIIEQLEEQVHRINVAIHALQGIFFDCFSTILNIGVDIRLYKVYMSKKAQCLLSMHYVCYVAKSIFFSA